MGSGRMSAGAGVRLTSALLLLLAGCTARGEPVAGGNAPLEPTSAHQPYRYQPPPALDDGWATASLDSVRIDRNRLEQMTDAIRRSDWNVHAVLIEREGRLVYEEYFPGEDQRWGRSLGRVNFDRQAAQLAATLLVDHIIPAAAFGNVMPEPSSCGGSASAREH